jgi:hypothetical protein
MDDSHDNFMADIIASGTNTIATFTDEEYSQADMYLNIPPIEEDVAPVMDTSANNKDNAGNNEESLVNESIECSHEVGQPCAPKKSSTLMCHSGGHCKGQHAHQLQRMEGKSR